jgi:hypothetical protein
MDCDVAGLGNGWGKGATMSMRELGGNNGGRKRRGAAVTDSVDDE